MNQLMNNKESFKLGELCGLSGVKPYVLRFWESEFEEIKPIINSQGEKIYSKSDLDSVVIIKKLLFEEKLSIEKAKHEIRLRTVNEYNEHLEEVDSEQELLEGPSSPTNQDKEEDEQLSFDLDSVSTALKRIILKSEAIEKANSWI